MIGSISQFYDPHAILSSGNELMNSEGMSSLDASPVTKLVHVANFAFRGESPSLVPLATGRSAS